MTKTIDDINLNTWYMRRKLENIPAHFVATRTSITDQSLAWIYEKCTGRFGLYLKGGLQAFKVHPYFEDPREAMLYELVWG